MVKGPLKPLTRRALDPLERDAGRRRHVERPPVLGVGCREAGGVSLEEIRLFVETIDRGALVKPAEGLAKQKLPDLERSSPDEREVKRVGSKRRGPSGYRRAKEKRDH